MAWICTSRASPPSHTRLPLIAFSTWIPDRPRTGRHHLGRQTERKGYTAFQARAPTAPPVHLGIELCQDIYPLHETTDLLGIVCSSLQRLRYQTDTNNNKYDQHTSILSSIFNTPFTTTSHTASTASTLGFGVLPVQGAFDTLFCFCVSRYAMIPPYVLLEFVTLRDKPHHGRREWTRMKLRTTE